MTTYRDSKHERPASGAPATDGKRGSEPVPPAAKWLGALGVIPFVALALAIQLLAGAPKAQATFALSAYGAVILSFLGGIRWGLAISRTNPERAEPALYPRLITSVLPSLIGWVALLLPGSACLILLAATFLWVLWSDVRMTRRREAPVWYPRLRWPLTTAVVLSLLLVALV